MCIGLPEMKGGVDRSNSFNFSQNESLCTFQTYYSKDSHQPLRVFSNPPCNTFFKCKETFFSHKNHITNHKTNLVISIQPKLNKKLLLEEY